MFPQKSDGIRTWARWLAVMAGLGRRRRWPPTTEVFEGNSAQILGDNFLILTFFKNYFYK
jgi:hypothetical protein